ncbi:hypothetical protein L0B52_03580 [Suttonella sp. R2A3]|uniref:PilC/PilY family type IV pilus protein n=1 Tax=Suttonella sp. R2A3 TaxID=2908648 RepID=UPI001F355E04|nr:PilC/PilY family type IV pilus protein [Suttonella sp. R2A3]UJF25241.1 hypothetical protein L0B52_03580 [Suttonella sp. R2A3]
MSGQNNYYVFKHSALALSIALACSLSTIASAADEPKNAGVELPRSPFASVPLHLQETTTTVTGNRPKPNVMLVLDDSGSMGYGVPGSWKDRITVLKDTLTKLIDGGVDSSGNPVEGFGDKINWAVFPINIDYRYWGSKYWSWDSSFGNAAKALNNIDRITADGGTPGTTGYVRGLIKTMDALQYRCQKSYVIVVSDGDSNASESSSRGYKPIANYLTGYKSYFDDLPASHPFPKKYVFPWFNVSGKDFPDTNERSAYVNSIGARSGAGLSYYSYTAARLDIRSSGTDVEGKGWNEPYGDPDDPGYEDSKKQTVQTFTIGFGDGVSAYGTRYLKHGAQPNPVLPDDVPTSTYPNGYFVANSEDGLYNSLRSALSQVETSSAYVGGDSVSISTPTTSGSTVTDLAAYLTLDSTIWGSQLLFNKVNPDGTIDNSSQSSPIFPNSRWVMINNGSTTKWLRDYQDSGAESFFGLKSQAEFKQGLMPWLLRDPNKTDAQIENAIASVLPNPENRSVQKYRKRTDSAADVARMMGDVLGAPILTMMKPNDGGRERYVVTAANDGMVYFFKANGNETSPYTLLGNYIPGAMQREAADGGDTVAKSLKAIAETGYGRSVDQPHLYLNNGGMVYRTTPLVKNSAGTVVENQQTLVVGAMGQGGRGVYALNIGGHNRVDGSSTGLDSSTDSELLANVPLWETQKGSTNKLGYTVGTPQIGQVATQWFAGGQPNVETGVRLYAFFGNGYNINPANVISPSPALESLPTLYVYDVLGQEMGTSGAASDGHAKGTEVTKISATGGIGGLASPTLVDVDFDGVVDVAYAGDYGGNMYRFDLRGAPSTWSASKIYQGAGGQPITAAPAVFRQDKDNYIVIFGTGSDIYQADLHNKHQQALMGVFDDLSTAPSNAVTQDKLLEQNLTETTVNGKKLRFISKNEVADDHKGWIVKLPEGTGERIVVKPEVLTTTAFFTTRSYSVEQEGDDSANNEISCDATSVSTTKSSGQSWLMGVDVRTGGALTMGKSAYFTNQTRGEGDEQEAAAGFQLEGMSTAVVLFGRSSEKALATTPNGDAGGSGEGAILSSTAVDAPDNTCMPSAEYWALVGDQAGLGSQNISVKKCEHDEGVTGMRSRGLYRLNLRDITF